MTARSFVFSLTAFFVFLPVAAIDAALDQDFLDMSLEDLLQVTVVSASKKEERLLQAPLAISTLTGDEIQRAGATSWGEALRLLPGLIVREQASGNFDVHVRGFDNVPPDSQLPFLANTLTLVMIDNRIVYNYFAGGTFWETLPVGLQDVKAIEVVRGPASPLYGPNAAAGVIHIITKKSEADGWHSSIHVEGGQDQTQLASLRSSYRTERFQWQLTARHEGRERTDSTYYSLVEGRDVASALDLVEFDTRQPSPLAPIRFPDQALAQDNQAATMLFQFTPNNEWRYDLGFGFEESEVQKAYFENGLTPLNTATSETRFVDFRAEKGGFRAHVAWLQGDQEALGVAGWAWEFDTLDAVLEYDHSVNDQFSIRPGLSYRKATYDGVFIAGEQDMTTVAASLRAEWNPSETMRVIAAVRADQYDTPDTTEVSTQLAVSYSPDEKQNLRFTYGKSNRAPFIIDTFQDTAFTTPTGLLFELRGNRDLDPLTSESLEIGWRYQPSAKAQFEVEAFYARNENYSDVNLIFAGPDGEFFRTTGVFDNLPVEPELTGATLSLTRSITETSYVRAFVTLTDTRINDHIKPPDTPPGGDGPPPDGDGGPPPPPPGLPPRELIDLNEGATPEFYGGIIFDQRFNKWHFNLNLYTYDGGVMKQVIEQIDLESKIIANTKLTYTFGKRGEVFLNIRNLNDDDAREFLYTDRIGRQVLGGFNLRF
ncbi:TonB-dependent receptor plug domain-containing protein [Acanthopleuribacter pedis]|uniref:TonB-dependent receptor n=1 Tax=Acanthopleuribacter pedis TaxID=442870 RepID=A0A8J7Q5A1_9BACT|nr:TonB-dependent receptor [Acanthopleuribacter pedis]MBO1319335.1 TonB-dependent receptor [Acanthopleuribacter pedis]